MGLKARWGQRRARVKARSQPRPREATLKQPSGGGGRTPRDRRRARTSAARSGISHLPSRSSRRRPCAKHGRSECCAREAPERRGVRAVSRAPRRRRFCSALRCSCAVAAPPRRRRYRSDRAPASSSPARMRIRVPARVAEVVAASDGVAIAIARFPSRSTFLMAPCRRVPWRRVFGSLVVASLSRRVAIITSRVFSSSHEVPWREGRVRKPPRASDRSIDRPTTTLPTAVARAAPLSNGDQPSPRGGCCGRLRRPRRPSPCSCAPGRARRALCVVNAAGPPPPWLRAATVLEPALRRLSVRVHSRISNRL